MKGERIRCKAIVRDMKGYIAYVHLKGSRFEGNIHEYKAVGEGEINWTEIFDWLNTSYNGYAMIEYENPPDVVEGTKRSLDFITKAGNTRGV